MLSCAFTRLGLNGAVMRHSNLLLRMNALGKKFSSQKPNKEDAFRQKTQQMLKELPEEDVNTYEKPKTKGGRIFFILSVGLLSGLVIYAERRSKLNVALRNNPQLRKRPPIGSEWSLVGTDGKSLSSYDLRGSYYLIYFGFTKCPDVCPATLIQLTQILDQLRRLPQWEYLDLKTVFVSVDPDRDTPEKLKKYLHNFDPTIIGATAPSSNHPDLVSCLKAFKIYSNKVPSPTDPNNYLVDHTTIVFLMNPQNEYLAHLNPTMSTTENARAIAKIILQHEQGDA